MSQKKTTLPQISEEETQTSDQVSADVALLATFNRALACAAANPHPIDEALRRLELVKVCETFFNESDPECYDRVTAMADKLLPDIANVIREATVHAAEEVANTRKKTHSRLVAFTVRVFAQGHPMPKARMQPDEAETVADFLQKFNMRGPDGSVIICDEILPAHYFPSDPREIRHLLNAIMKAPRQGRVVSMNMLEKPLPEEVQLQLNENAKVVQNPYTSDVYIIFAVMTAPIDQPVIEAHFWPDTDAFGFRMTFEAYMEEVSDKPGIITKLKAALAPALAPLVPDPGSVCSASLLETIRDYMQHMGQVKDAIDYVVNTYHVEPKDLIASIGIFEDRAADSAGYAELRFGLALQSFPKQILIGDAWCIPWATSETYQSDCKQEINHCQEALEKNGITRIVSHRMSYALEYDQDFYSLYPTEDGSVTTRVHEAHDLDELPVSPRVLH